MNNLDKKLRKRKSDLKNNRNIQTLGRKFIEYLDLYEDVKLGALNNDEDDIALVPKSEALVQSKDDLLGDLDSSLVYIIDGKIDMEDETINVPSEGLTLIGFGFNISSIYSSSDNATLFSYNDSNSGSLVASKLSIYTEGSNSQIFDLDNNESNGSIELNTVNLGSFDSETNSFGTLNNYRQLFIINSAFINYADGFTLDGNWAGGMRITSSIILGSSGNSTLFNRGGTLVFQGSSISDINAASIADTDIVFDFIESNFVLDSEFVLSGARFNPNADAVALPESSVKAFYRDCVGIQNTRPGAEMEFTEQSITPLTQNSPVKAQGTTVTNGAIYFEQTENNKITALSSLSRDYNISVNAQVNGGANDNITLELRKYNGQGGFEILKSRTRAVSNIIGGNDIAIFNFRVSAELVAPEYITLFIDNESDDTDATVQTGSEIIIDAK